MIASVVQGAVDAIPCVTQGSTFILRSQTLDCDCRQPCVLVKQCQGLAQGPKLVEVISSISAASTAVVDL